MLGQRRLNEVLGFPDIHMLMITTKGVGPRLPEIQAQVAAPMVWWVGLVQSSGKVLPVLLVTTG